MWARLIVGVRPPFRRVQRHNRPVIYLIRLPLEIIFEICLWLGMTPDQVAFIRANINWRLIFEEGESIAKIEYDSE